MIRPQLAVLHAVGVLLLVSGCAHAPAGKDQDPETLLADACRPGQASGSVKGSIWMRLDSKEAKGQFPASVDAAAPDQVTLEVTNLLGSREALIQVHRGSYSVDMPNQSGGTARRAEGSGSWGGIPLQWASELFLGRIPCPSQKHSKSLKLEVTPGGELIATSGAERFVYHFRRWAGHAWAETLQWKKGASTVDFKFDEPDDKSGSPRKWEAKSPRGVVKVRWRDIQISGSHRKQGE